jgi:hypothetical protein
LDAAGDVNGDGREDLIVLERTGSAGVNAGRAYVVFGSDDWGSVDLDTFLAEEAHGFVIEGPAGFALLTGPVGIGDFDGDGFDDIYVVSPHGGDYRPAGYVVYGGPSTQTRYLADLGEHGFEVVNDKVLGASTMAGTPLGDINCDGRADLAIQGGAQALHVVLGHSRGSALGLSGVRDGTDPGFVLMGGQRFGYYSALGDVDGDGLEELIVVEQPPSPPAPADSILRIYDLR